MKLFLVVDSCYQGESSDYGSFVVCAENEGEAVKMNPSNTGKHPFSDESGWTGEVTYLGEAAPTVSKDVILASYYDYP